MDLIDSYFTPVNGGRDELRKAAKLFAATRGSRSRRTAKQFYSYYAD
jgi:predicted AAA+ superfamily ATPase